jgi:hypothetical protein
MRRAETNSRHLSLFLTQYMSNILYRELERAEVSMKRGEINVACGLLVFKYFRHVDNEAGNHGGS